MTKLPVSDRAREKFNLWFFRDLSDEQRKGLIGLILGKGAADEAKSHGYQREALKMIFSRFEVDILAGQSVGDYVLRDDAAKIAECAFDDRPRSRVGHSSHMDWEDGYREGTQAAASAIRAASSASDSNAWAAMLAATPASDSPAIPEDDWGCDYCRNDGALVEGSCPRCDAEYPDDQPAAASHTAPDALREACEPWADYHGDLPDYDHPLRPVFEGGIQYAVELLAKELGVEDWTPCEGTEEFDGDLGGTLMNIVLAAMPKDEHGDPVYPRDLPAALAATDPLRDEVERGS